MIRRARQVRPCAPMLALSVALILAATAAAAPAVDPDCAEAWRIDGWCEARNAGYVAGVEVPSRLLYEVLDAHGHVLDLATVTCPTCRKAIETDGFCEEHRIGFVKKLAYFSRLTYEMGRGGRVEPDDFRCADCRRHAGAGLGWCAKHRVGMIGSAAIRDRAAYDRAAKSVEVLRAAVAMLGRCEDCAVAMVTDTECWHHRIPYVGGVAQPPTGPPRP